MAVVENLTPQAKPIELKSLAALDKDITVPCDEWLGPAHDESLHTLYYLVHLTTIQGFISG